MDTSLSILIIDNNEVDRTALQNAIREAGVQATFFEARDSMAAIALMQSESLDCIFLNDQLPDKNSLTVLQEIRNAGIRTPLVVLTEQGDEQIAVDLMKAGASDYMAKYRVTAESLSRVIRNSIRVYQAELRAELAHICLQESHELLKQKNQELEQKQQQIQLQNLQLLEVSRLKSQFLSIISHELRTPLNAIMGFSKLLMRCTKGALNSKQIDMVERIYNNSRQLQKLINEILDFSKIGSEYTHLTLEEFNLTQLVEQTIAMLSPLAHSKGLAIATHINLLNPVIHNDRRRVHQILVNLLSNAIKFTPTGQVELQVNDATPDVILIAVRDTGLGIAEADLEHIFEPFRQVDQSTTRREGGTGLGLAITGLLVKMMHGQISVESQPNQGSTFRLELPRRVPSPSSPSEPRSLSQRHRLHLAPPPSHPSSTIGEGFKSRHRSIVI